jgi:hypothetical protein
MSTITFTCGLDAALAVLGVLALIEYCPTLLIEI